MITLISLAVSLAFLSGCKSSETNVTYDSKKATANRWEVPKETIGVYIGKSEKLDIGVLTGKYLDTVCGVEIKKDSLMFRYAYEDGYQTEHTFRRDDFKFDKEKNLIEHARGEVKPEIFTLKFIGGKPDSFSVENRSTKRHYAYAICSNLIEGKLSAEF